MANPFPGTSVSAAQVGGYFVSQYYQVLQQQPDFVYRFYTDASTMIRVDGDASETAAAMVHIHSLITSLNFTAIEILSAHSLESWNGGVLVMVSGSVQIKDFISRRKFVQTFFLAPQEKGYFVLNDIFHFLEHEPVDQRPAPIFGHGDFDSNVNASDPLPESVSDYMSGGQARDLVASAQVEDNETVDKYSIAEQSQQVPEVETTDEEIPPLEELTPSFPVENTVRDHPSASAEEPVAVAEPQKHTYASILRVAKGQSGTSAAPVGSLNRAPALAPALSEWQTQSQPIAQQVHDVSSTAPDRTATEVADDIANPEDECESRSVYVGNLPPTVSASDVEQEFRNFGRIRPDGIVIRNRKDMGVCYAFIEFEDAIGVQNALKASPVPLGGRQVFIEERRANSSSSRGGRRGGRGRGGYQSDASRGRFGSRNFGRSTGQESLDRPRGNGYHPRSQRQERGFPANQVLRNSSYPSDAYS